MFLGILSFSSNKVPFLDVRILLRVCSYNSEWRLFDSRCLDEDNNYMLLSREVSGTILI